MPLISWNQTAIQDVAYVGGDKHLELMTALGTLLSSLTNWTVETTDLNANGGAYVIRPDPGSAYPNQRIIIFSVSTGVTSNRSTKYAPPYTGANLGESKSIGIGYCRDVSSGVYTTWDSTNPFGLADVTQWWRYQIASDSSDLIDHMYAVESEDGISLFFNRTATASWWGMVAGYLMEDIGGVPFSMCATSGPDIVASTFWSSTNAWMDGSGSHESDASFKAWKTDPSAPDGVDSVTKLNQRAVAVPQLTTSGGTRVHLPRYYRFTTVPLNFAGNLRQIRMGEDVLTRTKLSNGGGPVQSILFAPTLGSIADSLAFDEG